MIKFMGNSRAANWYEFTLEDEGSLTIGITEGGGLLELDGFDVPADITQFPELIGYKDALESGEFLATLDPSLTVEMVEELHAALDGGETGADE